MLIIQNREFSRVYRIGMENPADLEPEELTQFNTFQIQVVTMYEALYFQFLHGAVDETYWKSKTHGLRAFMLRPGSASWWERCGQISFDPRFQRFIEQDVYGKPAA